MTNCMINVFDAENCLTLVRIGESQPKKVIAALQDAMQYASLDYTADNYVQAIIRQWHASGERVKLHLRKSPTDFTARDNLTWCFDIEPVNGKLHVTKFMRWHKGENADGRWHKRREAYILTAPAKLRVKQPELVNEHAQTKMVTYTGGGKGNGKQFIVLSVKGGICKARLPDEGTRVYDLEIEHCKGL